MCKLLSVQQLRQYCNPSYQSYYRQTGDNAVSYQRYGVNRNALANHGLLWCWKIHSLSVKIPFLWIKTRNKDEAWVNFFNGEGNIKGHFYCNSLKKPWNAKIGDFSIEHGIFFLSINKFASLKIVFFFSFLKIFKFIFILNLLNSDNIY